jgi:hypothetical protein
LESLRKNILLTLGFDEGGVGHVYVPQTHLARFRRIAGKPASLGRGKYEQRSRTSSTRGGASLGEVPRSNKRSDDR